MDRCPPPKAPRHVSVSDFLEPCPSCASRARHRGIKGAIGKDREAPAGLDPDALKFPCPVDLGGDGRRMRDFVFLTERSYHVAENTGRALWNEVKKPLKSCTKTPLTRTFLALELRNGLFDTAGFRQPSRWPLDDHPGEGGSSRDCVFLQEQTYHVVENTRQRQKNELQNRLNSYAKTADSPALPAKLGEGKDRKVRA